MHLGNSMGQYASRTRFCEVMINNSYQGIYLIMEKIKRDENRVDIANLKEEDIDGVELTGGYIYRKDKGDNHWNSQYGIGYQFVYPKIEDVQGEQFAYLQTYVDSFEIAVGHPSYSYAGKRYDEYIDLNSFVETFILNELSKNADGYRLSSYFYKEKDSAGGKIFAGPFWDFNLSFRNANYCEAFQTFGWMYSNNSGCSVENPFWWDRMVQDEIFTTALRCRYQELRQSSFQLDSIFEYIDEKAALLEGAQERNFEKYDILGQYIWPNPEPFASSYLEEIQQLKNWINNRLNWMDSNMFGECPPTSTTKIAEDFDFELSPNPFSNNLILQINRTSIEPLEIKIQNIQGQVFYQQKINHMENSLQIIIPGIQLTNGIYFACVTSGGSHMIKKVIKVE